MAEYAASEPAHYTMEEPVSRVRWLVRNGERILQQYWSIKSYVGASVSGLTGEWRDVPTESE